MKPFLPTITLLLFCSMGPTGARAQVFNLAGFTGSLPGSFFIPLATALHGETTIGTTNAITFGFSEAPSTWTKTFSIFTGTQGLAPNAQITVTEHLMWNGTGPSPFEGWHMKITAGDGFKFSPNSS